MRVLLSSYDCAPTGGTESRLGWAFASHLGELGHEVHLLTNTRNVDELRSAAGDLGTDRLQISFIESAPWIERIPVMTWRLRYLAWQRAALREARRIDRQFDADLVHHVSWTSLTGGSMLWKLGKPFVFGPIGGGQVAPAAFKRYFGDAWRAEHVRSLFQVGSVRLLPNVRSAVQHAEVVLAANRETRHLVEALGARRVRLTADVAVPDDLPIESIDETDLDQPISVLWVARNLPCKALGLALEAMAGVDEQVPARFEVIGVDGNEAAGLTAALGLTNRVTFTGYLPWDEVVDRMRAADVLLFSSLRETGGLQIVEAMACGMTVVALDHQGPSVLVDETCGVLVPVTTPEEARLGLARAITELADDRPRLHQLRRAALERSRQLTWPKHVAAIAELYPAVAAGEGAPSRATGMGPTGAGRLLGRLQSARR